MTPLYYYFEQRGQERRRKRDEQLKLITVSGVIINTATLFILVVLIYASFLPAKRKRGEELG